MATTADDEMVAIRRRWEHFSSKSIRQCTQQWKRKKRTHLLRGLAQVEKDLVAFCITNFGAEREGTNDALFWNDYNHVSGAYVSQEEIMGTRREFGVLLHLFVVLVAKRLLMWFKTKAVTFTAYKNDISIGVSYKCQLRIRNDIN